MAQDVLGLMLPSFEADGDQIPAPSKAEAIDIPERASLVMIEVNTDEHR
jgi:hypothetical protein